MTLQDDFWHVIVVTVSRLQHALTALDAQPSRDLYCNDGGLESDSRQADASVSTL